jgi:prevent-host-death family protein
MSMVSINLTEAKQNLGEMVNRVAYGGERIMLLARGKPRAALVSVEDLQRLESLRVEDESRKARRREALAAAHALRAKILARTGGVPLPDSVEELHQLREERIRELAPDL